MAKKSKELKLDMDAINNQHIIDVDLNSEMKKAYIDYAMSVIVSRALPDVRDGMKPVHRRILYDMYDLVIPAEHIEYVIEKALEKARGEKNVRKAIEKGMSATEAFATFGIL